MKKFTMILLIIFLKAAYADENTDALNEIQQRTQIPYKKLTEYLSDCNSNQQSMYFCAWNNSLVAQYQLHHLVVDKKNLLNDCAEKLQLKVWAWEKGLYPKCRRSSISEWGNGSMQPTAQMICMSSATNDFVKSIKKINNCNQLKYL